MCGSYFVGAIHESPASYPRRVCGSDCRTLASLCEGAKYGKLSKNY